MPSIAFIDAEVDAKKNIIDLGGIRNDGAKFHKPSLADFQLFINPSEFLVGHNIVKHDIPFLKLHGFRPGSKGIIDTLYLSPLLFPAIPYHALVKDYKINPDGPNDPLIDAIKAQELFNDEVNAFSRLDEDVKSVYYHLLHRENGFDGFFQYIGYHSKSDQDLLSVIRSRWTNAICENVDLKVLVENYPVELAYSLSLILNNSDNRSITPPWIVKNFHALDGVMNSLRNTACSEWCIYCNRVLNPRSALKHFFAFDKFRTYGGLPLQEDAVTAAINGKSILTIFPTGGGKSITFQLPALIAANACKALTVVISPLQSLMKDQVDNLEGIQITEAVTINGLLNLVERRKSFERVASGAASILYISPESLRSTSITNLLLNRKIARFVIDEAHCFSSWGQDFRVDYLYIGEFIKELEKLKNLSEKIPVSCFTATAKPKVIEDIQKYFKDLNGLELQLFTSTASRTNLSYQVFQKNDDEEKYRAIRDLILEKQCPTIVYCSRTRRADEVSDRLNGEGIRSRSYHGRMEVKEKTANQNAFIGGEIDVMVATSAFGMGVDKKDVGMVIHHEISDSLENYVQEAGRAGRDEKISAECFVLFNDEDLGKHFTLLNLTKLSIKEVQQVWRAIKDMTKLRPWLTNSALEIARRAGWDDSGDGIETRVTMAVAALEAVGYVKRGKNFVKVFANSILAKSTQEAIEKINSSSKFDQNQKPAAIRIIKKLISTKNKKEAAEETPESRIDYISDHLGIDKREVVGIINLLVSESILADQQDLTAFIKKGENKNRSLAVLESFSKIEREFLRLVTTQEQVFNVKKLNELLQAGGCSDSNPNKIKTIINFWAIKKWIERRSHDHLRNSISIICKETVEILRDRMLRRQQVATFIVDFLFRKISDKDQQTGDSKEHLAEFSLHEIKTQFEKQSSLFDTSISISDVEDALFFLSRIDAVNIEGGFMVIYNALRIERLEHNNNVLYKDKEYRDLERFYENRVRQIHIAGEYARRMITDPKSGPQLVDDYFRLDSTSFLNAHFPKNRHRDLTRNITPAKYKRLFESLSPTQKEIIDDSDSRYIVVAAGPGSGKTKLLVHKLASLALIEDVKPDQMLMVTFSRAAVTEFKRRLFDLIGNVAYYVDIKTFHSYSFDILGKVGTLANSNAIIAEAVEKIRKGDVEGKAITKTVLVIDEAQDMDQHEFALVNALIEHNEEMRVIAVGDDDQNIYSFRESDSKYFKEILSGREGKFYELTENYRSTRELVEFSNRYVARIQDRLKTTPIIPTRSAEGKVKLTKYRVADLTMPLIDDVMKNQRSGSTCILTRTNKEASIITGALLKQFVNAKLIQGNDGFNLYNLVELRYFFEQLNIQQGSTLISDDNWIDAKRRTAEKFKRSSKWEIVENIIAEFEFDPGARKYKSDFEIFVKESRLEDFYAENGKIIFVSTIHKAKGKEFDNVFLMIKSRAVVGNDNLRTLYVGVTRAKNFLSIHTDASEFDGIETEDLILLNDNNDHQQPSELLVQGSMSDVWLDSVISRQYLYESLMSGDKLLTTPEGCTDHDGIYLLRFSKECKKKIAEFDQKGYQLKDAVVSFIVHWKKEETGEEYKVIIPDLIFEKK